MPLDTHIALTRPQDAVRLDIVTLPGDTLSAPLLAG